MARMNPSPARNIMLLLGRGDMFRFTKTAVVRVVVLTTCIKCLHGLPRIAHHLCVNHVGVNSITGAPGVISRENILPSQNSNEASLISWQ